MSVFEKIVKTLPDSLELKTPKRQNSFTIEKKHDKTIFSVGTKTKIPIPKAIWDGIPKFLSDKGWVDIGSGYNEAKKGLYKSTLISTLRAERSIHLTLTMSRLFLNTSK